MNIIEKIFGTTSKKEIDKISGLVDKVESFETLYSGLSEIGLKAKTKEFKTRLAGGEDLDDVLPEAFAVAREVSKRVLGLCPYRVQLIGGVILHQGRVAEMRTGEGKTLAAVLPAYLNALTGNSVHIVTVNDYLAARDAEEMGKVFKFLGLSVGVITHDTDLSTRKEVYRSDIVYGTNNEFGFDYLRDNMMTSKEMVVQRDLSFAIIDEVDSILIDEARTPLIISGPSDKSSEMYHRADELACQLTGTKVKEVDTRESTDEMTGDYVIDEKHHSVIITNSGYEKIEKFFNIEDVSDPANTDTMHYVNQAIRAHGQMEKDKDYIVENGEIIIVDEFTGRLMYGRRYNDGLHQAIEAKEHLVVNSENVTLATITFQNYFRMYSKLSGMTGTAKTEEAELQDIYNIDVVVIPTNEEMVRKDNPDQVYMTVAEKEAAIVRQVATCKKKGQPILVGAVSVEKSERLSDLLTEADIDHKVLNAKNHRQEARIIAQAGRYGAVTIATNMAGRGTDILLGGNPVYLVADIMEQKISQLINNTKSVVKDLVTGEESEVSPYEKLVLSDVTDYVGEDPELIRLREIFKEQTQKVKADCTNNKRKVIDAGGLFILGTERHESRRIDNQLRGRSGRQGDVGETCFMLSLEDDLLRIFGGDKVKALSGSGAAKILDGQPMDLKILSTLIERAQKNLEGINYQIRRQVIQYDDVVNKQRELIYKQRREVLTGVGVHESITKMLKDYVDSRIVIGVDIMETIEGNPILSKLFESEYFEEKNSTSDEDNSTAKDFEEAIAKYYKQKIGILPDVLLAEFEKSILLTNVDRYWKEHIDNMEELKKSIHLRGYAQKDPIQEYKNEGVDMFNEMTTLIRESTVEQLIVVDYVFQVAVPKDIVEAS